ncbi:MAG: ATP-binding cassette domain-containing protein [Christensenellaceae bacterium]|nr:ATP-binding cassette domain-containing protein [Christensenellaceae bacterium]
MNITQPILSVAQVSKSFGGTVAVRDVSFDIAYGERCLIIGTNGAGKSTLFNLICGDLPLSSGKIEIFGHDVSKMSVRNRSKLGLRRTYQGTALFNKLTIRQNFYLSLLGAMPMSKQMNLFTNYKDTAAYTEQIEQICKTVQLSKKIDEMVANLSHGERRQLEVGLALICHPQLLLLDEPSSGLSANERLIIQDLLMGLDSDITLVLVEHNMELAFAVATRVIVMMNGEIVDIGTPLEIQNNPYVQEIYLGGKKYA